jgi:transposase
MDEQQRFPRMEAAGVETRDSRGCEEAPPRLRRPDRSQMLMEAVCLDDRLPAEHPARTMWSAVERLDLSKFYEPLKARGSEPGRAATDPKLLIALWLYAATEGVGSGRELARLCECHDGYRWLCGGVKLNYHTLNDFRVGHEEALDDLLSQMLATLVYHGVVSVQRISQDGTRVRASAGSSTFRREPSIQKQLKKTRRHVRALKRQMEAGISSRQQAAEASSARDREDRLRAALAELPKIEASKQKQKSGNPSKERPARVSTTDPEARVMRMADGGFRPAYNVQIATDTESRAVVGVDVTNVGSDANQSTPMREQVERRTGTKVQEHLVDGDFVGLSSIEEAHEQGVKIYAPPPVPQKAANPYVARKTDSEAIAAWRERMATAEGQKIYLQRCSTVETVNADLKAHRGLTAFTVRGMPKVKCIVLWMALAYNLSHFAPTLIG